VETLMTDTLHERCLRAAEEALPCSHTSHTCEKGNHFMPCHGALRYAVATAVVWRDVIGQYAAERKPAK